jgi:hypothetical protein
VRRYCRWQIREWFKGSQSAASVFTESSQNDRTWHGESISAALCSIGNTLTREHESRLKMSCRARLAERNCHRITASSATTVLAGKIERPQPQLLSATPHKDGPVPRKNFARHRNATMLLPKRPHPLPHRSLLVWAQRSEDRTLRSFRDSIAGRNKANSSLSPCMLLP